MYNFSLYSKDLPLIEADANGNVGNIYYRIDDSRTLECVLDYIRLPKKERESISAAYVISLDGDYDAVWLSVSSHPWGNDTIYHPLPYWNHTHLPKKFLPEYWRETNKYYQK